MAWFLLRQKTGIFLNFYVIEILHDLQIYIQNYFAVGF